MLSDIYQVVTPENIELDYEIAGIGSRFLASAIDLGFQGVLITGVAYAFQLLKIGELHDQIKDWFTSVVGGIIVLLMVLVIFLGYYIILETIWNGQTLGKRIVNIRVRKEGGYAPSFWDILLRNIIRLVDFIPFFYGAGLIVMFLNDKAKRLGDFAAATIVVKEMPRKEFSKYLKDPVHTATLDQERNITPEYLWLSGLIPLVSRTDYLIMINLIARRASLVNYPDLAALILRRILSRAEPAQFPPEINNQAGLIDQAGRIVPELAALYEKLRYS